MLFRLIATRSFTSKVPILRFKKFDTVNSIKHNQFRKLHNESRQNTQSYINYYIFGGISIGVIFSAINIFFKSNDSSSNVSHTLKTPTITNIDEKIDNNHNEPPKNNIVSVLTFETQDKIDNPTVEEKLVLENESTDEEDKNQLPSYVPYLIVGGGTAAMSAFKAIRANDPTAKILIITEELYKPYMRPPLSKDMWFTEDENLVEQFKFKQWNGDERRSTKNLSCLEKPELRDKITLFRNIEDFKKMRSIVKQGKSVVIIGGGFLGSELACALGYFSKKHGGTVVQVFPESGNLGRILPEYLSQWVTGKVKEEGASVINNAIVQKAELNNDKVVLTLKKNDDKTNNDNYKNWITADHVIVAVGIGANINLGVSSDLEIDNNLGGYLVNAELQARNSIWVAGDAACFYDIKLGRRRVEHHDHAVVTGRLAGENMTGAAKPYIHQSMFWSDLGSKVGFEAIGIIDSSLKTLGIFAANNEWKATENAASDKNLTMDSNQNDHLKLSESNSNSSENQTLNSDDKYGKGIIFYLKDEKLVGILTWNLFKRMTIARKILNDSFNTFDLEELARIFRINFDDTNEENK